MFCDFIEELQKARASVPGFDEEKGRTIVFWLMRPNESVRLTVCVGSMASGRQRIVVGKRSAKKMTNWA